jgi:hypothetical protein
MGRSRSIFCVAAVLLMGASSNGCNSLWNRRGGNSEIGAIPTETPTAAQLVRYLNANSEKIQVLECSDVTIDGKQGYQAAPTLYGNMVCQKPHNFRLQAKFVSNPAVDIGSNDQEFWYWIGKADPHVFHVDYKNLGNVREMPFPIQPDWVVETLGMATLDETKTYKLGETNTEWLLEEAATTPQGQPVRKVTVFNKGTTRGTTPQITGHKLLDEKGNLICSATILEVQQDPETHVALPRKVVLRYEKEKMELKMTIGEAHVAKTIDAKRAETLFQRKALADLPDFDLARGRETPTGVQRAGGLQRIP